MNDRQDNIKVTGEETEERRRGIYDHETMYERRINLNKRIKFRIVKEICNLMSIVLSSLSSSILFSNIAQNNKF